MQGTTAARSATQYHALITASVTFRCMSKAARKNESCLFTRAAHASVVWVTVNQRPPATMRCACRGVGWAMAGTTCALPFHWANALDVTAIAVEWICALGVSAGVWKPTSGT